MKFVINRKYRVMPCLDTAKGDLKLNDKQLEIKGSLDLQSGGPSSFGPTEEWHRIYFVDCKDHYNLQFKLYEIKLSNTSNIWKKIKVNKKDTYEIQCSQGLRPRVTFSGLIKQIPPEYIELLLDGNIDEL